MIAPTLPIRRRSPMIISGLIIAALIMVAALLAVPARPAIAEPAAPLPGYHLAWADEFDGTRPDGTGLATDDWYYRESEKAICSNSPDNVSVSDGALQIALKREDRNGMPYTCGGVISKQWFGYGYYETRAKLWGDQGFHSALWTTGLSDAMPDTPGYKGPNNRINEIDGFEIDSHAPTKIAHHSHWFTPRHIGNQGGLYEGPDSSDGFHTYGFEWRPNEIRYYVDGTLARVRHHQRPRYGYYVDHVVDVIGVLFLFGGMAASGIMSAPVAAGLLIAYLLLSLEVYLATHSLGRFQMSFFGMGPSELRILLALGNFVLLVRPSTTVLGTSFTLFDVGGMVGALGLVVAFVYSAARNTRALYRAEPIPAWVDR